MTAMSIRLARPDEHEKLSALALRSKAYWGYSTDFLEACRPELTYTAAQCGSGRMWVADTGADVVGLGLIVGEPPTGELDALFVDPPAIGTGCGKQLLLHLLRAAAQDGFSRLDLEADPQAAPFYCHFGAELIGTTLSGSIPDRVLPRLSFRLGAPPAQL